MERYKVRLDARGFTQKFVEDYDETFSPVVRFESFRSLVALAAKCKLQLHQMDVTTAFLHGLLKEDVCMKQPDGFVEKGKENLACKLKRSLYGLKQSPRCWNEALDGKLFEMGFKQTSADPCLYVRSSRDPIYVAVYVDDLVIAAKDEAVISCIKSKLSSYFNMKDMGRLHHISMHWALVNWILRYLRGTLDLGLRDTGINAEGEFLNTFCDADWAGDLDERKSTSGYVMMLSYSALSWRSEKQTVISLSTAEAEHVALSAATQEVNWMRKLLDGLGESMSCFA